MKRIAVLTSGGDAPGMNAAVRAVVRTSIYNKIEVMGIKRGFNGLINRDIIPMGVASVSDILQRGGTIIHTARSQEFKLKEVQEKAAHTLKELEIDGLIVIGGDGSFKGAQSLSKLGINTIGIPGTIDNDIPCTDSTIGFDTAVNTALESISKIRDTTISHERANIIEVMGRHCGNIALFAGLAGGAEAIIIPEIGFDVDEVSKTIEKGKNRGKLHTIIVLAEGAGEAGDIGRQIYERTGMEIRTTKLGYVQRGGSPTAFDRMLASRMGSMAVDLLLQGETSRVVCIRKSEYIDMDINKALSMKREFNNKIYKLSKILSI